MVDKRIISEGNNIPEKKKSTILKISTKLFLMFPTKIVLRPLPLLVPRVLVLFKLLLGTTEGLRPHK